MDQFDTLAAQLLSEIRMDMRKDFTFEDDALVCGRWVPLVARFDISSERKVMGVMPTGGFTHCHERCLFLPVQNLTQDGFGSMLEFITQVHDTLVQPDNTHEFSLFSLVLLTDIEPSRALQKQLRSYAHEIRYVFPQSGWSSTRVAIIQLPNRKLTVNKQGSALANRLSASLK